MTMNDQQNNKIFEAVQCWADGDTNGVTWSPLASLFEAWLRERWEEAQLPVTGTVFIEANDVILYVFWLSNPDDEQTVRDFISRFASEPIIFDEIEKEGISLAWQLPEPITGLEMDTDGYFIL